MWLRSDLFHRILLKRLELCFSSDRTVLDMIDVPLDIIHRKSILSLFLA